MIGPKPNNIITVQDSWKKKGAKFVYIQRNDDKHNGSTIDIPVDSISMTLKNHPSWKIVGSVEEGVEPAKIEITAAPKTSVMQCPICGEKCVSESVLKRHKITHETPPVIKKDKPVIKTNNKAKKKSKKKTKK